MFNTEMIVSLIAAALLGAAISYYLLNRSHKSSPATPPPSPTNLSLALQAYERLLLLADRIALPNLINR